MEGFTKIPNTVFELGLTPSQFIVLCNLIRVQSYREYKGEVEDGWFAKSQNELSKECGFGSHNTLTKILQGMSKNDILQIKPAKAVTYFKIDMGKMTIGQNEDMSKNDIVGMSNNDTCQKMTMSKIEDMSKNDIVGMSNNDTCQKMTMSKIEDMSKNDIVGMLENDIEGMSKIDYLHNNINNNIKQDNYINLDITVDTSTSTNNKTTHIENKDKEKEVYDIDSNTGNRVLNDEEFQNWCYGCVDKFNSGIGIGIEPSVQQVLGFMLDNNEGYYKSFFESYSTNEEGRLQIPLEDVNEHLYQLIQPMASTYGYSISDNSEVLSKFNKWYFKSRLNDIKVDLI